MLAPIQIAGDEPLEFRSARVAIVHGNSIPGSEISEADIHNSLSALFSQLKVDVLSSTKTSFDNKSPYDIIALIGDPNQFRSIKENVKSEAVILSFGPEKLGASARKYLRLSDALILYRTTKEYWLPEVSRGMYRLFESLIVPSMLNVDVADVKRISKGIGITFSLTDDDHDRIIDKLPRESLVARSALLHFSCKKDVSLSEVYSISKAVTVRRGIVNDSIAINSHGDARKIIRKINVKMGIRIIDDSRNPSCDTVQDERRINLTAIMFGI